MINVGTNPIFGLENIPSFKKGSGIHIKKKNRGKFTKSAKAAGESVQEHAAHVLSDPNATPLLKKRANFARNAAKWKHQLGGPIVTKEMEDARYLGEVTPGKTFGDKVLDIGNAIGQFVPFLGTALDTKERLAYAATAGATKDAAIPLFIKGASKTRLVERPSNHLNYAKWRRGYGWIPAHSKGRYTAPLGSFRGFRGFAKGLGVAGLILDTPNMVSDIENLKRALGFNYNHLLLMKE